MKNSKTLFMCAVMALTADVMKIIVNIGDIYPINKGWATHLICSIVSVWLIFNSKVKHKIGLTILGVVTIFAITAALATLATLGIVEIP
jgi:hypothetical protein